MENEQKYGVFDTLVCGGLGWIGIGAAYTLAAVGFVVLFGAL